MLYPVSNPTVGFLPLRSWKAGGFWVASILLTVRPIVNFLYLFREKSNFTLAQYVIKQSVRGPIFYEEFWSFTFLTLKVREYMLWRNKFLNWTLLKNLFRTLEVPPPVPYQCIERCNQKIDLTDWNNYEYFWCLRRLQRFGLITVSWKKFIYIEMVAVNETGWQPHYADRSVRGGFNGFRSFNRGFKRFSNRWRNGWQREQTECQSSLLYLNPGKI